MRNIMEEKGKNMNLKGRERGETGRERINREGE